MRRFNFFRFHAFSHQAHGQNAQDLSNFKQFIVSAFCWCKFHSAKFYHKKLKISLSRVEFPFRIKCRSSVCILNYNSSNTMHVNNCIQSTYLLNIDYICMDHTVVCYNVTFSFIPHIA